MIPAPYGGELVERTVPGPEQVWLRWRAGQFPRVHLSGAVFSDLRLLATGALSPLTGFMGPAAYRSVLMDMELPEGLPWALPVVCPATAHEAARLQEGERAALIAPDGEIAGVIEVEEVYERDPDREARLLYGSEDESHPGRAALDRRASHHVSGAVTWLYPGDPWSVEGRSSPAATREAVAERGWRTAAAFLTPYALHRPQEYLLRCALELTDGVLVQPLVGRTADGEAPAELRIRCCRTALEAGFPAGRVLLSAVPAAPRYAGPREAIHHAILARNHGASHVILGGGPGGEEQGRSAGSQLGTLFDRPGLERLGVQPLTFEEVFYCELTGQMATARTSPAGPENRVRLSGAEIREALARGERPPETFVRPEVADLLLEAREAAPRGEASDDAAEADPPVPGDAPGGDASDSGADSGAPDVLDWHPRDPGSRPSSAS